MKILFFFLFLSGFVMAGDQFPSLSESDFENISIIKQKEFDGNSLWGHINGGADLYLEYGFDKLLFQQVNYQGIEYRVELYRMSSQESAFGIFSVLRFDCLLTESITEHICVTGNQIQAAVGKYYISISNEVENESALNSSFELYNWIISRIIEDSFFIPLKFQELRDNYSNNGIKLIKGTLGLQNGFPEWESLFEGFSDYSLLILPMESGESFTNYAEIIFPDENSTNQFITRLSSNPLEINGELFLKYNDYDILILRKSNNQLNYIESNDLQEIQNLIR